MLETKDGSVDSGCENQAGEAWTNVELEAAK